ncbi:MAG: peptidoglycan bridge formation glycyltransferase FemA/FemB family protein [Candidatus Kerfeldbacteria bacterium]|nr:peptidoglycan bridge formation glycyltransferase FemA/FemB family protein [Candidatus Kerfeldbacteria bacterium]
MQIVQCQNKEKWEDFLLHQSGEHISFLQSWQWGEMYEKEGRQVYRFLVQNEASVAVGAALCVLLPLPYGRAFLFSPRGPICAPGVDSGEVYTALSTSAVVQDIIRNERVVFWRFEPAADAPFSATNFSQRCHRVSDVEPSRTHLLDLTHTEEELLAAMKMRTRYNVRLAVKKGVEMRFHAPKNSAEIAPLVEQFWQLLGETSARHGIRQHPKEHYIAICEALVSQGMIEFGQAWHEGDLLIMNMMVRYGDTVTYLHAGSTRHKTNLKAAYGLQWETIRRAKVAGFRWYDFYGIGPEGDSTHRLATVTDFKIGFCGTSVDYPGTFEFPFSRFWYRLYVLAKRLRS